MLSDRTATVLKTLVEEYIDTAVPVASESIAGRSSVKVSSATVRNKMVELAEEGYILRPHISSGGVPSNKGYRFYIESLDEDLEPPPELRRQVRSRFGNSPRDLESWVKLGSDILSNLADNMAIVTSPRPPLPRVKYIQIIQIQEFLALLILVLEQAKLRKQLIPLENPYTQDDLTVVANKLNTAYSGLTYKELLSKSVKLTPFEETVRQDALNVLKGESEEEETDHSVDGIRLLLGQPEFAQGGAAQQVVEILEHKILIKSILSEVPSAGNLVVHIGEENAEETLKPFSIILCQYGIPETATGVIGVVGPTRMEYSNAMVGVRFLSSFMSDLVTSTHSGLP